MPLSAGTKLGEYEITGALGKGGMGEVYRAARAAAARFDVALNNMPYYTLPLDGRNLAYTNNVGGAVGICIRALDSLQPRQLPGTEGATYPFWSPDGVNLGFFPQGKLKKIDVAGGLAQTLCETPLPNSTP